VFTPYMYECKDILSKRLPIHFEDDGYFDKIRLRKNDFLGYIDEKSTDRYSAAKTAYSRVAEFLMFYRVLSNRKKEFVRKNGYVKELGLDRLWVISTLPNGYKSIEAEPAINISYAADNVILSCQGKPRETRIHISKLIDLHNQALRQYDLCDGFLNLWSILEVVCSELSGESKIEKVINGIVPTLKKDYLHELIGNIQQDLSDNLEKVKYESLISKITDKYPKLNPVWCMIFLPEFDELLDELFHNELEHYPVIRNKIYRLYILREHKSEVKCLYDKYAQRIKWHIYRLYRARNAIVHSGETPPHIQSLGEHLHIYADRLLLEILFKLSFEPTLKTVSDILIDTRLKLNQVMTQFESKEAVSEADISCVTDSFYYVTRR